MSETLARADCVNETCPWSGDPVSDDSLMLYRGAVVGFCNPGCCDKFQTALAAFDASIDVRARAAAHTEPDDLAAVHKADGHI
ncbi:MAG: glutathione S-transferase [Pseudomonadota bacterium]